VLPSIAVLIVPVLAAAALVLGLGIGLAVAALSAHYRDFGHAVPFLVQVLLYGSPVVYSMEILPPSLANVAALNPLVPLIEAFRWSLLGTAAPTAGQVVLGVGVGTIVVIGGILVFSRATRDMADVI
jgi:lipopolysaccharide transport system permease protein